MMFSGSSKVLTALFCYPIEQDDGLLDYISMKYSRQEAELKPTCFLLPAHWLDIIVPHLKALTSCRSITKPQVLVF